MPNLFLNLPAPSANAAGAAVDVSGMGQLKTIVVGGSFDAILTIEYATDDTGTNFAPIAGFQGSGHKTVEVAARWMRVVTSGYKGGAINVDVGASGNGCEFVEVTAVPASISGFPPFKTVVVDGGFEGAVNIEVSEDGVSWAQVFSFQKGGGQSALVYGAFVRASITGGGPLPAIWMAAGNDGEAQEFPTPFVSPQEIRRIYVRASGSDLSGNGKTIATAYRTIQRGVLDVPLHVPGGVQYIVDCTDLIDGGPEILPQRYAFPRWVSSRTFDGGDLTDPQFLVQCAVNIRAELRNVPSLGVNAIVDFADLVQTSVGGPITGISNAVDAEVTTTSAHGLFLQPGVQQVTIAGVNNPLGATVNGSWPVEVTGPTTFRLIGCDTSAAPVYSGGGAASVLFVQDQISGQVQIKVNSARWTASTLKGKQFIDPSGSFNGSVIYDNTVDTLYLTTSNAPLIAPGSPGRIAEQSAELHCVPVGTVGFVGGCNSHNQDSFAIDGVAITVDSLFDDIGLHMQGGRTWIQGCRLEHPAHTRLEQANSRHTYMVLPEYVECPIYQSSGLFEFFFGFALNWSFAFDGTVFIDPFVSLCLIDDGGFTGWYAVKVINPQNPALDLGANNHFLDNISIVDAPGDGVVVPAQGVALLNSIGGNWAGVGLLAKGGAQVRTTPTAFNDDYSAGPNVMQVGLLTPRTFADFRVPATGGFVGLMLDIQNFNANPADFGAYGTSSRVYEE